MTRTPTDILRAIVANLQMAAQAQESRADKINNAGTLADAIAKVSALSYANAFRESVGLIRSEAGTCEHGTCLIDVCDRCEHG